MSRLRPWLFALLAAGLAAAIVLRYSLAAPLGTRGLDIDQVWWASRELLANRSPYRDTLALELFGTRLYYPLTAAVIAVPLAPLPIEWARLAFLVGGAGLFGYAIGRDRPSLWPSLLGMPFLIACRSTQWSPLLTAGMLLPSLGWLAAAKPNLGVVMLAGCRTKRAALILLGGGAAVLAVSLAAEPSWPWSWREALRSGTHLKPLLFRPAGFLLALALLRWRDPDARLLLALACVPVTGLFYDVLPACLVARTRAQSASLALLTLLAWQFAPLVAVPSGSFADQMWGNGTLVLWFGLLPPLALLLLRDGLAWGWVRDRVRRRAAA